MLLLSRWPLLIEDSGRLQSLFVHSKADKVTDGVEVVSLFVVEHLVRRRSIARDLYQPRRHTVTASYCVSYRQLHHLTDVLAGTFMVNVWGRIRVNKRVKPAYLANIATAIATENRKCLCHPPIHSYCLRPSKIEHSPQFASPIGQKLPIPG